MMTMRQRMFGNQSWDQKGEMYLGDSKTTEDPLYGQHQEEDRSYEEESQVTETQCEWL